jgi:hypothetical protein
MQKQNNGRTGSDALISNGTASAVEIGYIIGFDEVGNVQVRFGNSTPVSARLIETLRRDLGTGKSPNGRQVLVVFESGDRDRPIIIGLMENRLESLVSLEVADETGNETKDLSIDGRQVTIEAEDEILLRCGKGSILIKKDGKIIIKGTNLLSRSSGPNRVKGASVALN